MSSALRGSLRLYIIVAGLWALAWGWLAYDAHQVYAFNRNYVAAVDATSGIDRRDYGLRDLLRAEFLAKRNFDLIMVLLVPVGLPFVIAAGLWISVGFRSKDR